jgi:hypothetical protein
MEGVEERTSAAPLTYWAWPPMREGCWSDIVVIWLWWFGRVSCKAVGCITLGKSGLRFEEGV